MRYDSVLESDVAPSIHKLSNRKAACGTGGDVESVAIAERRDEHKVRAHRIDRRRELTLERHLGSTVDELRLTEIFDGRQRLMRRVRGERDASGASRPHGGRQVVVVRAMTRRRSDRERRAGSLRAELVDAALHVQIATHLHVAPVRRNSVTAKIRRSSLYDKALFGVRSSACRVDRREIIRPGRDLLCNDRWMRRAPRVPVKDSTLARTGADQRLSHLTRPERRECNSARVRGRCVYAVYTESNDPRT